MFDAVGFHDAGEKLVVVDFDVIGVVLGSEGFGAVIAVFLEVLDFAAEAAKQGDGAHVFVRIGFEQLAGFGLEQEFGEVSGSGLESDFGELAGVFVAEEVGEVVLAKTVFDGVVLFEAPLAVTAAGFPIGDVALGGTIADFVEGADDVGVGDAVAKHKVDHIPFELGEPGDCAVAPNRALWVGRLSWRGWKRENGQLRSGCSRRWYAHIEPSAKSQQRLRDQVRSQLNHWTLHRRIPEAVGT